MIRRLQCARCAGISFSWARAFFCSRRRLISKMALLFGTTWVVNSIVIAGLLSLIVAANILVEFCPRLPVSLAYGGIFATLLASYWIPLERFFFSSLWAKALVATLVLCLPVFFA